MNWKHLRDHRNFFLLMGAVFCVGGGFGIQIPLFANFIHERFGIHTHQYGYLEALRETPGFLTALFGSLTMLMAAHWLGLFSLLLFGAGIAAYAWIVPISNALGGDPVTALILTSVLWSIGFHSWAPIHGTLSLQFAPSGQKGRWLGWLRTSEGVGQLAFMGLAFLVIRFLEYEGMFLFAGGILILGGLLIGAAKPTPTQALANNGVKRFVLKKDYTIYYFLAFLQGARKQIFLMFAVWLLVRQHGVSRETILLLMMVNQAASLLTAPTMGKLIDKHGERATLFISSALLVFVFVGYAYVPNVMVLCGLYVVDNLLYVGAIALTTYLNKIAPPEDIRPTLTMGVTMNHIPSVLVPLIGGLLWERWGSATIFLVGAGFTVVQTFVTLFIHPDKPEVVTETPAVGALEPSAELA